MTTKKRIHVVSSNVEWLTPPEIIKALGKFDLDPCSPIERPWSTAKKHFTVHDDGLYQPWRGRVWLNPPYGREVGKWVQKLSEHGNGIAMLFVRTDTPWFHSFVFAKADAILFLKRRVYFYYPDGTKPSHNAGGASCLVAYRSENVNALIKSEIEGHLQSL